MTRKRNIPISIAASAILVGAVAVGADDDFKTFKDCRTIADTTIRLACYDAFADGKSFTLAEGRAKKEADFGLRQADIDKREREVAEKAAEKKVEAEAKAQGKTVAEVKAEKKEAKQEAKQEAKKQADSAKMLQATVVKITKGPYGKTLRFHTKGGAVWAQKDRKKLYMKPPFDVVIMEGILGSYNLIPVGTDRLIKVKRLK